MTNTQKATLRKVAKKLQELWGEVEQVQTELDEYIFEHQDTLDGTYRGEKLDGELDELCMLEDSFKTLKTEILDCVE